jgi:hypothetical protein
VSQGSDLSSSGDYTPILEQLQEFIIFVRASLRLFAVAYWRIIHTSGYPPGRRVQTASETSLPLFRARRKSSCLVAYANPKVGARYLTRPSDLNHHIPTNLYLVVGDEQLEVQASRVAHAANGGPPDGWRLVHGWISDLIADIRQSWNVKECAVFIDCNPSFTIYTELAMTASDRLIIPFSADGSSKRAVRAGICHKLKTVQNGSS